MPATATDRTPRRRRVVVVGVGSTIGAACAHQATGAGAEVFVVDPEPSVVDSLVAALGPRASGVAAGLTSPADATAAAARCREVWPAIDAVIACGAAMEHWPAADDTAALALDVIAANVLGPLAYTEAFHPLLAAGDLPAIAYLGSIDGLRANPQVPAYSMGKGALVTLTHAMAARLGADGIRVNCVAAAGVVQSGSGVPPLRREVGDAALARRLTPLGRMPEPGEIAAVLDFLVSPAASYVSGAVVPVDGGRIAATPGTW